MGFRVVWKWDGRERKDENDIKACVLNKGKEVAINLGSRLGGADGYSGVCGEGGREG